MSRLVFALLWMAGLIAPAAAWEDPELGIRFSAPQRWQTRSQEPGARVRFVAPAAPGLRSNIGFQVVEPAQSAPLGQEVLAVTRELAGTLKDYRLLGSKPVPVAGLDGCLLSYRATVHGKPLQATQVMLLRSGRLLLFTLTTEPDRHADGRESLDAVLNSIEWLDEPPM